MTGSCARPACDRAAVATMSYDYAQRSVWVGDLDTEPEPSNYDLCRPCGDRMTPPRGWVLTDTRARALFGAAS